MEFTLLGGAVLAVAAAGGVLWIEGRHADPPGSTRRLADAALAAGLAGLLAGRLASMVAGGTNPLTHPADIIIIRSGVDTGFAALAALLVLVLYGRRDLWRTIDGLGPAALAGLAGWHLSGVFRDAWLGTPSSLPWAAAQAGSSVTRHPVEVYAALALLIGAAALHFWKRRSARMGMVGAAALLAAAAVRLGTEPLRIGLGTGPERWYAAGAAAGIVLAFWRWRGGRPTAPSDDELATR